MQTLSALVLVSLLTAAAAGAAEPANVVFLFADDLGYGSVSSHGGEVPTPHIDSIGAAGVRFTSGYMTAPVCNPSRHGMLTGRYQQRWGKELNSQTVAPRGQERSGDLPLDLPTIADAMKKAGYATGAFGKWQLSWRGGYHPLERGFDHFVGMVSGMDHLDPSWPNAHAVSSADILAATSEGERAAVGGVVSRRPRPPGPPQGLFRGRQPIELKEYLSDQLANEAIDFIERNKDRPFFVYLPFYAVHSPIQVTDEYYQRAPAYDDQIRRIFAGMVVAVDDAVGKVLAKLRESGLEEKTLVIFASDNGAQSTFDVARDNNAPLIGHKRNLYEGGIRVPFAMQWKGRIPAIGDYPEPISSLDIFPTALAAAGVAEVAEYELDGVDLLPFLKGDKLGSPHEFLFWRSGPNAAVRHGQWKLLMSGTDLVRLYDVEGDEGESKDRASEHPALVKKMMAAFEDWAKAMIETRYNGDVISWHI